MALGGGRWEQQDKNLDGTYVNFNSIASKDSNNKMNYNTLENLPKINGVEIKDEKSLVVFGLVSFKYMEGYVEEAINKFLSGLGD